MNPYNYADLRQFYKDDRSPDRIEALKSALVSLLDNGIVELRGFGVNDLLRDEPLMICLTEKGRNDVQNRLHNEELQKVQDSVITTNKIQKIALLLTIGISLFTAVIAWLNYKKPTTTDVKLLQPLSGTDTLRLHTTQQDTISIV